jgi:hypothetical protein
MKIWQRVLAFSTFGLAGVLTLLAACGGDDDVAEATIEVSLEAAESTVQLGEPINLTVRLTNVGSDPVIVAKPFFSPNLVFFQVTDAEGEALLFNGPYAKLKPFTEDDFAELESGDSVEQSFDLAQLYEIDEAGSFTVVAKYKNSDDGSQLGLSAFITDGLLSDSTTIEVVQ